jgi:hypothetical protein
LYVKFFCGRIRERKGDGREDRESEREENKCALVDILDKPTKQL